MTQAYYAKSTSRALKLRLTLSMLSYFVLPNVFLIGYAIGMGYPSKGDTLVLLILGALSAIPFNSFVRGPSQFAQAFFERTTWLGATILAILLKLTSIFVKTLARIGRLFIALTVAILYGISPIDFFPDVFLGLGWIDDMGIFLLSIYWGSRAMSIAICSNLKATAKGIMRQAAVTTSFP